MSLSRLPKSDRRVIVALSGLIAILAVISIYHSESLQPAVTENKADTVLVHDGRDSFLIHQAQRQEAKIKREQRYKELKDSFAHLKELRELKRQERETRYLTLKDSFAQLKQLREQQKAEREAAWERRKDSLKALRPEKLSQGETIELNSADSIKLMQIPGIGKGLASAIIQYRKRLGGFYKKEQVLEINGIPTQVVEYLEVIPHTEKLNINELSLSQLRKHPYMNFYRAKAIIEYRRKYGAIKDLNQLSLLQEFDDETISNLKNYIKY